MRDGGRKTGRRDDDRKTRRRDGGRKSGRLAGLLGLGVRRVAGRLTGVEPQRVLLAIVGVALAIGLLVSVTGLSLGLATGTTVRSSSVDYWIVPESGGASSIAVSTAGPKLGDTHGVTARLEGTDGVEYATPVLVQVLPVENPQTGGQERVLAIGVIPPARGMEIGGLETGPLSPGDPYFANGSYDGRWTGEMVLSEPAARFLNASTGSTLRVGSGNDRAEFQVTNVSAGNAGAGFGQLPVMVVHLSELQAITGGTGDDVADQILVSTNEEAVASTLEGVYPGTIVVQKRGLASRSLMDSSLPLAVAIAAFVTALGVGALFVATMMGLEVAADRRNLAVLGALGYSTRSRALLVAVETVTVAGLGGLLGVLLGIGGILALNAGVARYLGVDGVAMVHPWLPLYGVGIAVLVGVLAAPYPVLRARRTGLVEVIAGGPR